MCRHETGPLSLAPKGADLVLLDIGCLMGMATAFFSNCVSRVAVSSMCREAGQRRRAGQRPQVRTTSFHARNEAGHARIMQIEA